MQAEDPIDFLHHAFVPAGDVQNGKSDKEAVAGGINEGGGLLESAAQIGFGGFGLQRVRLAANAKDLRRDGVAGSVIGPHRGGCIGDTDALDGARLVGRHPLALDRRDTRVAKGFGHKGRAAAQNPAQGGPLAHLLNQADGPLGIAERQDAGVHRHADADAGLNGIHAVSVAELHHLADGIQVVNAAVGAQRPVGFVLHTGGDFVALLVVERVGALDNAAGATGMVVELLAQPAAVGLKDRFAGNAGRALKAPAAEAAGRQAARLVQDVDQRGRPIGVERALGLGNRVRPQCLQHLPGADFEGLLVGVLHTRRALGIHHDELQPLAAHHRAQAAAAGVAGGTAVHVVKANAGVGIAKFARRADAGDVDAQAETGIHFRISIKETAARVLVGGEKLHARLCAIPEEPDQPVVAGFGGLALHNDRLDAHLSDGRRKGRAGVRFFDPAGQGRLGPH